MKVSFTKMTGAGNDFVVVDNRDGKLALSTAQIERLCNRNFGIGADGLLAVEPAQDGGDFRMRYYNADGGEADMCGNGARCFANFVRPLKGGDALSFETKAGLIRARFFGGEVEVNLTPPKDLKVGTKIPLKSGEVEGHSLNTGVPHVVLFVEDADKAYVSEWGREIRYHSVFAPKGTNVNFVQITGPSSIRVRTYERGVEGETLACGTGVTASGILAHVVKGMPQPISITVQSGAVLKVNFLQKGDSFEQVTLQGPAERTFTGEIEL
jgi:diaminopimelate epimerase